jgi:putative tricarboxylic transport membrane protein
VNLRDLIAGLALLAAALVWISLVYLTIEPSQGPEAGARAFPLFLGVALALFASVLTIQGLNSPPDTAEKEVLPPPLGTEVWYVGGTVVLTVLYGATMEKLGFIVSSAVFVAALVVVLLRIRRPLFIAAMAVGLSVGAYVVFGKLLHTYLPPGTWLAIQF